MLIQNLTFHNYKYFKNIKTKEVDEIKINECKEIENEEAKKLLSMDSGFIIINTNEIKTNEETKKAGRPKKEE